MSRKDFELIASVVSRVTNVTNRRFLAEEFANELQHTNPQFKRQRFIEACGVVEKKR